MNAYLSSSADISVSGQYRYSLMRRWSDGGCAAVFIGLNPSTADIVRDDSTIRRCVEFARSWGYSALWMGNIYAYRATDPRGIGLINDPVGPRNATVLKELVTMSDLIVAAWGAHSLNSKALLLADWILSLPATRCLGQNKNGSPKHPLYLPYTTALCRPRSRFVEPT